MNVSVIVFLLKDFACGSSGLYLTASKLICRATDRRILGIF